MGFPSAHRACRRMPSVLRCPAPSRRPGDDVARLRNADEARKGTLRRGQTAGQPTAPRLGRTSWGTPSAHGRVGGRPARALAAAVSSRVSGTVAAPPDVGPAGGKGAAALVRLAGRRAAQARAESQAWHHGGFADSSALKESPGWKGIWNREERHAVKIIPRHGNPHSI